MKPVTSNASCARRWPHPQLLAAPREHPALETIAAIPAGEISLDLAIPRQQFPLRKARGRSAHGNHPAKYKFGCLHLRRCSGFQLARVECCAPEVATGMAFDWVKLRLRCVLLAEPHSHPVATRKLPTTDSAAVPGQSLFPRQQLPGLDRCAPRRTQMGQRVHARLPPPEFAPSRYRRSSCSRALPPRCSRRSCETPFAACLVRPKTN